MKVARMQTKHSFRYMRVLVGVLISLSFSNAIAQEGGAEALETERDSFTQALGTMA